MGLSDIFSKKNENNFYQCDYIISLLKRIFIYNTEYIYITYTCNTKEREVIVKVYIK